MNDDASKATDTRRARKVPQSLAEHVADQAELKLRKRAHPDNDVWCGLGMMGLIGWSVAVPTVLGAALGIWLDSHYPGRHSWTLALLVLGLAIGCFNAWHWVATENREMHQDEADDDV